VVYPHYAAGIGCALLCEAADAPMKAARRLLDKKRPPAATVKSFWKSVHDASHQSVYLFGRYVWLRTAGAKRRFDDLFWCYATCDSEFVQRHFGVGK
jgi:hypothetical protein